MKFKFKVMFKFDAEAMVEVRRRRVTGRRGVEVACLRFIVDLAGHQIWAIKIGVRRSFNNHDSSQLPRLAAGQVAVTNGYSHRMFCSSLRPFLLIDLCGLFRKGRRDL